MFSKILFLLFLLIISQNTWAQGFDSSPSANPLEPISMDLLWNSGIMNKHTLKQGTKRAKECMEKPELNSALCDLVRHIEKNIDSSTPLSELFTARVAYVGEIHITSQAKVVMIENIKALKAAGYTTLAMEMWNSSAQDTLDNFIKNLTDPTTFETTFHNQWSYNSAPYIEMMNAARDVGVKIIAIDVRDKVDKKQAYTFAQELEWRDEKMAENLSVYLNNNPEEKVIVFCGQLHAYTHLTQDNTQSSQIQYLKAKTGIQAQSFIVVGSTDTSPWNFGFNALGITSGTVSAHPERHFTNTVIFVE